jgi:phosphoribosylanthranilate isomerase
MRVFVKICGMTDAAAVAAAVACGADAVGFVFHPASPRHLPLAKAVALAAGVPRRVLRVAVMLHPKAADCADVIEHLAPDVLQTDLADFDYLDAPDDVARWPVLREHEPADLARLPATFVYEGRQSGKGVTVDWSRAAAIAGRGRMMLAGGLDVDNVARAIAEVRPWGVDVSSGVESAPGIKDPERISAFISAARAAASRREQVQ